MHNLWLEFLVEEYVSEQTHLRECGSCQGGCVNPAICLFMCSGCSVDEVREWYYNNKEELCSKWEYKQQCEYDEYCRMMEATVCVDG